MIACTFLVDRSLDWCESVKYKPATLTGVRKERAKCAANVGQVKYTSC